MNERRQGTACSARMGCYSSQAMFVQSLPLLALALPADADAEGYWNQDTRPNSFTYSLIHCYTL